MPDAVACARYHVLSNSMGGVPVEYMEETDKKAWVRFRYPRWMYDGPTLCGMPVEASRGFLKGWYAQNGVTLENPKLGFVCVSEDMTGQFGLCGYFKEYDHDLSEDERLAFAPDERPPPFDADAQPAPPAEQTHTPAPASPPDVEPHAARMKTADMLTTLVRIMLPLSLYSPFLPRT